VELLEQGESAATIARILGVHEMSVYRWQRLARSGAGLQAKPHPGPTPGLSAEQLRTLEALLQQGAKQHGYANNLWTAARVAALIRSKFGREYHPEHVRKILKQHLGWTSQRPQRRAREQNDKEVERWKADDFRRLVGQAWLRNATLVFLDESGFQLTPVVRSTLAPRGQTPLLDAWERHDRISAISCLSWNPRSDQQGLFFELLPEGLNVCAAFLNDLRRELPGPLTIAWDRHNIHSRSRLVRAWLAGQDDVALEDLPPYAPQLNPDEMVWSWIKYGRLCNLSPHDVAELRDHLEAELQWAHFDKELLQGFFNHAHLGFRLATN
jgi:transposase